MIIGHEQALFDLECGLPPVTLLLGPSSIGKTTLAVTVVNRLGCRLIIHPHLTADIARRVVETAPVRGWQQVYVLDLDNSTEAAQNILLKVLEEPPAHCRFILIASGSPLATIMSRSRVHRLGLLSDEQVEQVLRTQGIPPAQAAAAAPSGRGRVAPAMAAAGDKDAGRVTSVVAAAIRAAVAGGGPAMDMALRNWTYEHTAVMRRWAVEASSQRWVAFSPDFAPGVTPRCAMRALEALSEYPDARTGPAVALAALTR